MLSWMDFIEELFRDGHINEAAKLGIETGTHELCPICNGVNAFAVDDADPSRGIEFVRSAGADGWECGHCGCTLAERSTLAA